MAERIVVGMYEAKTQLSKLVKEAAAGKEVVVENHGTPVAKIVGYTPALKPRKGGFLAGKITVAPDFDELPDDIAEAFGMK